jgi:hypothetical protein
MKDKKIIDEYYLTKRKRLKLKNEIIIYFIKFHLKFFKILEKEIIIINILNQTLFIINSKFLLKSKIIEYNYF